MASKRQGGGKLGRSEIVHVRLDRKLRKKAELAAAKERRTLSSFIEWAVERAVKEISVATVIEEGHKRNVTADEVIDETWATEEADRFILLAQKYPELLTFEEQRLWSLVRTKTLPQQIQLHAAALLALIDEPDLKCDRGIREKIKERAKRITMQNEAELIVTDQLRRQWETFKKVAKGELPEDDLSDLTDYDPDFWN